MIERKCAWNECCCWKQLWKTVAMHTLLLLLPTTNVLSKVLYRAADPMGDQQITDLLAYCCIVGLYCRYLVIVFPAVLIMCGVRHEKSLLGQKRTHFLTFFIIHDNGRWIHLNFSCPIVESLTYLFIRSRQQPTL